MERAARATELHERICASVRRHNAAMHAVAVDLAELAEQDLYAELGYGTIFEYGRSAHAMSGRKVRDLLNIGRSLSDLPVLGAAFASGELPWTKCRTMLPVLTPDNEEAWVERARSCPVRDLEAHVACSGPGEPPPDPNEVKHPARTRLVFEMHSVEAQVVRDAIAFLRARTTNADATDGEMLAQIAQRALQAADDAPAGERYKVVLEVCPECTTSSGQRAHVEDSLVAEALCDCEVVELDGPQRGRASRTIPPRVRRAVTLAYKGACAVPGCCNRLWIDLHHECAWSRGGPNTEQNLVPLCSLHHRMCHDGRLTIERVGGFLFFRFGYGRDLIRRIPHVGDSGGRSRSRRRPEEGLEQVARRAPITPGRGEPPIEPSGPAP